MEPSVGEHLHGFTVETAEDLPEIDGRAYTMRHGKSGARLLYLQNDDNNKSFSIAFKTPPANDTGVFHILEHSVLCGSRKFPVKEPFVNLLKSSMQTFLNAMTFPDKTMYPVASTNMRDLMNLADVYMDAVLHPNIYVKPEIFMQEGWHYELARNAAADAGLGEAARQELAANERAGNVELAYNGVVYNEMKGALSEPSSVLFDLLQASLFPDTAYRFESGGTPASIPELTYEQFLDDHRRHYRLDNSYITLYGNLDLDAMLAFFDEGYLSPVSDEQRAADDARRSEGLPPLTPNALAEQAAVVVPHARCTMATARSNACCALGYVVGGARDKTRLAAVDILLDAIMGSNEAPLKRAILDADLADDASGYVADSLLQPFAVLELRGLRPGAAERFRAVVERELERLASGGLDRTLLEASLSRAEFVIREHDFGMADGVVYAMSSLSGWLYDDRLATTYLKYEDDFAFLREALDTSYFADLAREVFLESAHNALAEVVPAGDDADAGERARLKAVMQELSDADLERIAADEARLRDEQEQPDSPEALAALPRLPLSEIADAPEEPAYGMVEGTVLPCLRHHVPTHGIAYVYRLFDLSGVSFDELPYVSVLAMTLGKLPTAKHSAAQIDTLTNGLLGNFSVSATVFDPARRTFDNGLTPPDGPTACLRIGSSALHENVEHLSGLVREIMLETDFSDTDRIHDRLIQRRISMEQSFASAGHSFAMARLSSYYRPAATLADALEGIGFYLFLKELLDCFDERKEALIVQLEELAARLMGAERTLVSFTGDDGAFDRFWGEEARLAAPARDEVPASPRLTSPQPQQRNEAFTVPTDVCYVATGGELPRIPDDEDLGRWMVAARALSYDYLWNEVRVKGGAYGTGFQAKANANACFYSYRDPHLDETLQRFAGSVEYLESVDFGADELEGYVVATAAGIDQPQKARALIRRQDGEWLAGRDPESRMRIRNGVVGTTAEDLRSLGEPLRSALGKQAVCVFGNKDIIAQSAAASAADPLLSVVALVDDGRDDDNQNQR
ncbi:insulinase family protein [Adlercreutzia aquisgranensis]|uniref:insulinase family protein n=1 Tax=Adlercreutzia aquisgranensis TaxID=2941323 RepID=UPI00203EC74A|nr:insulinase family protein [Adlercreutzia aquisgranensis]